MADRDVDDLVQEVFVVAFRRWHVLQPDANVPAWLYQIARRVAKDHRSSSNARVAREAAVPEPPSTTVDEAVDRERAAAFVESFIETLPDGQRQAFVLAEIEGWTAPEIAEAEGVKLATVYSRIRLAREALRAAVERRRQKPAGGT